MPRITKHNFAALEQERMIVDWIGTETSFHRQLSNRDADFIEFRAIRKSKAAPPRRQPAEQADKPGAEERDANRYAHRHRPAGNEMRPQKRKHEKVGPNHDLEIVPTPWRGFIEERKNKNCCRRQEKGEIFREFLAPTPIGFPHTPAAKADERQDEWNPG